MSFLLVTIDTEEANVWAGQYPREDFDLTHLENLHRLQALFASLGIVPTYLISYPVVKDSTGSGRFAGYLSEGACELGGHLHTWSTPPFDEPSDAEHSMPCHLPVDLVEAKLKNLTEAIRARFGIQPIAYRAGRYGSAPEHVPLLHKWGYRVETSVCPFMSFASENGPDYRGAPLEPYRIGPGSLIEPDPSGELLCIPNSSGFNRVNFPRAAKILEKLKSFPHRLHLAGLAHRLGLLRFARLNPEMTPLSDMIAVANCLARREVPVYQVMFHSPDIAVGGTPYVQTRSDLEIFYARLNGILNHLIHVLGAKPITLSRYEVQHPRLLISA